MNITRIQTRCKSECRGGVFGHSRDAIRLFGAGRCGEARRTYPIPSKSARSLRPLRDDSVHPLSRRSMAVIGRWLSSVWFLQALGEWPDRCNTLPMAPEGVCLHAWLQHIFCNGADRPYVNSIVRDIAWRDWPACFSDRLCRGCIGLRLRRGLGSRRWGCGGVIGVEGAKLWILGRQG